MPSSTALAFDLGAGSGRALLGTLSKGELKIQEISRFPNTVVNFSGHLYWNFFSLFESIQNGLSLCAKKSLIPDSIGIDTWGVDFGLLDKDDNLLGMPVCYRDSRTDGAMESFFQKMPKERVYELTGIQFLPFNTLFQLESLIRDDSPVLSVAMSLLFMPDLFHYALTGQKQSEFSFATTSQLFNPKTMDWDDELFDALGISKKIMQPVIQPGTTLGKLKPTIMKQTGLPAVPVVSVATHDTGSAVASVPAHGDDWAFLSSGTWSLMGFESPQPVMTEKAQQHNFTNEGGVNNTFRVLKNITGLWLLQRCQEQWAKTGDASFTKLVASAKDAQPFVSLVDPDHPDFLNPPDMLQAISGRCNQTGQKVPESTGATVRCILESIALKYRFVLDQINDLRDVPIRKIHIIGGGVHNELLCQFTADACNVEVAAGPVEATAIGNLLVQFKGMGTIDSWEELRSIVEHSFPCKIYEPRNVEQWDNAYRRFIDLQPI